MALGPEHLGSNHKPPAPADASQPAVPHRVTIAMKVLNDLSGHLYGAICVDEDETWRPTGKTLEPRDLEAFRDLIHSAANHVRGYIEGTWTP